MRTESGPLPYVSRLLAAVGVAVATGCGGGDAITGASAPPKASALSSAGLPTGPGGSAPSATPSGSARPDAAQPALTTVNAYFEEINKASQEGRVADVSATAMPGCQTCLLDIGVTRTLHDRGVHADVSPFQIGRVTTASRGADTVTARTTVTLRAIRLLAPAGNVVETQPAQPSRTATAILRLTPGGWRIESILYFSGTS